MRVQGLEGVVEISRDRWGMCACGRRTPTTSGSARAYAHAQDRLWQCDVQRRVSLGRLSEIAGGEGLTVDRLMRTLGIAPRRRARRSASWSRGRARC